MKLMKTLFTSFVLCGSLAAGSTFAEDKVVEQNNSSCCDHSNGFTSSTSYDGR
ncbi:putative DNA uptake protein ComE1 [Haemophilus influenzae]|uniref:Putative DNA uptake protein ComE1 n=1 Tax=Haemophilus influenzae TaxID=727 RepID=A0A2X1PLE7_HAEIF|nr:putative DNA uptake protein ComE1 [Haemophilus influenzae]